MLLPLLVSARPSTTIARTNVPAVAEMPVESVRHAVRIMFIMMPTICRVAPLRQRLQPVLRPVLLLRPNPPRTPQGSGITVVRKDALAVQLRQVLVPNAARRWPTMGGTTAIDPVTHKDNRERQVIRLAFLVLIPVLTPVDPA